MWTRTSNGANKRLVCTCESGVARCQSQHQCHFRRMNSMFEVHCKGKWAWQLSIISYLCLSWGYEWLQKSKDSLKACFENVNIWKWSLNNCVINYFIVSMTSYVYGNGFISKIVAQNFGQPPDSHPTNILKWRKILYVWKYGLKITLCGLLGKMCF